MGTGYTRNDTSDNIADGKVASAADIDGEFNAIVAAFNASTGHTHDGTSAEGAPITVIGPAQDFVAGAADFKPKTDSAYTLGTSGNRWSNVYSDALDVGGDITVGGTVDGRDVAADGTSLDALEALGLDSTGMFFISSSDVSGASAVDFTGFDVTKYDSYLFILMNLVPSVDNATLYVRTSTDGGSSYDSGGTDYAYVNAATTNVSQVANAAQGHITWGGVGNAANETYSGILHVIGPHLTQYTRLVHQGGYSSTTGALTDNSGLIERKSAADVDAVRFFFSSGNISSGTISMYGIKNS